MPTALKQGHRGLGGSAMIHTFAAALAALVLVASTPAFPHGGGLNACGCHFNRRTGSCHCHQDRGCGCACQPSRCGAYGAVEKTKTASEPLVCAPDGKDAAPPQRERTPNRS